MHQARLHPAALRDPAWWHWAGTAVLLVGDAAGCPHALAVALTLCLAVAATDVVLRRGDLTAMGVQIRLGFALLLAAGALPGLGWIHLVQAAGTTARIVVGYCPLERMLLMLPWNRSTPLTAARVAQIVAAPATGGGIIRFGTGSTSTPSACALRLSPRRSH